MAERILVPKANRLRGRLHSSRENFKIYEDLGILLEAHHGGAFGMPGTGKTALLAQWAYLAQQKAIADGIEDFTIYHTGALNEILFPDVYTEEGLCDLILNAVESEVRGKPATKPKPGIAIFDDALSIITSVRAASTFNVKFISAYNQARKFNINFWFSAISFSLLPHQLINLFKFEARTKSLMRSPWEEGVNLCPAFAFEEIVSDTAEPDFHYDYWKRKWSGQWEYRYYVRNNDIVLGGPDSESYTTVSQDTLFEYYEEHANPWDIAPANVSCRHPQVNNRVNYLYDYKYQLNNREYTEVDLMVDCAHRFWSYEHSLNTVSSQLNHNARTRARLEEREKEQAIAKYYYGIGLDYRIFSVREIQSELKHNDSIDMTGREVETIVKLFERDEKRAAMAWANAAAPAYPGEEGGLGPIG